ncbi:hypothetical protein D1007_13420 [Hordeum vulgare]|nr:hypothetical protein D1007_13420 [Hordeum vulgare]
MSPTVPSLKSGGREECILLDVHDFQQRMKTTDHGITQTIRVGGREEVVFLAQHVHVFPQEHQRGGQGGRRRPHGQEAHRREVCSHPHTSTTVVVVGDEEGLAFGATAGSQGKAGNCCNCTPGFAFRTEAGQVVACGVWTEGDEEELGCTGSAGDQKERVTGDVISGGRSKGTMATPARSSSVPRSRKPAEEKPLQKRESKTNIISRTKQRPTPSPKPDVLHKPGAQRSPSIAAKTSEKRPHTPGGASPDNMVKVSPPRSTSATTMGTSWESLPPALQTLGSGVMSYRDAAEMAAVEAMQEASAAEIVLRCLRFALHSAFADLAATAGKQSPQQTVDEFLALQAAIARSTAALSNQQRRGHAGEWLHAAVTADLAPFSLYTAPSSSSSSRKRGTESPAVSGSPRPVAAAEEAATWLETAGRELGEEMCVWFVGHVDRLLEADVAGTLGQLKRVNDWLDDVGPRTAAVERLKEKIFGYLLDHVESAVVALNGGVATNRRK